MLRLWRAVSATGVNQKGVSIMPYKAIKIHSFDCPASSGMPHDDSLCDYAELKGPVYVMRRSVVENMYAEVTRYKAALEGIAGCDSWTPDGATMVAQGALNA
jgi:hypothetical protein